MSNYTPTTATIRAEYAGRVEAWEMTYAEQEAARAEEVVEFDRWLRAHDAEVRAQALAPIRAALANHPRCDIHPDDDPIKCGWKQAVADIQAVLDRQEQPR